MIRRLTPITIRKMRDVLHSTKEVELGFPLCINTKNYNINAGEVCKGKECVIQVSHVCDKDEKFIGKYHTHVDKEGDNIQDLLGYYGWGFGCYGRKPDKITCYQRKGSLDHDVFNQMKTARDRFNMVEDKFVESYASGQISKERAIKLHDDVTDTVRKKFYSLFKIDEL